MSRRFSFFGFPDFHPKGFGRRAAGRLRLGLAVWLLLTPLFFAACDNLSVRPEKSRRLLPIGQRAADCQEILWQNAVGPVPRYVMTLDDLLSCDSSLTDDPAITFRFEQAGASSYRFSVMRPGQKEGVVCTAGGGCREEKDF